MTAAWTDRMTGARMQVDRQFQDRVHQSEFTSQQWGLVMTAVEFRIDNPETPEEATLVADTENVEHILPELDDIPTGMGYQQQEERGGGVLGRLREFLSGGGDDGVDEERLAAATELADEYATRLQSFLEEQGRWAEICEVAARE